MALEIEKFTIPSFENAELLAAQHWNNFKKWKFNSDINYDSIFSGLREIVKDLESRQNTFCSIHSLISNFIKDEKSARLYRHLRDFGSLQHFGTQQDIQLNDVLKPLVTNLGKKNENELEELSLFLDQNNLLENFLEDKKLILVSSYKDLLHYLDINQDSLLTKSDHAEAINFLKSNIKQILLVLPWESLKTNGFSKSLRLMMGILMYKYYTLLPYEMSKIESSKILLRALKLGYYFGVTYPLVDNIFDSKNIISNAQKKVFANILTDAISGINISSAVPNIPFLRELYRCCLELKHLLNNQSNKNSLSYIKIIHLAQVGDNQVKLDSACNIDFLFTRIILKSSFARIATASLAGYPINNEFIHNSIFMGINNQLSNDFEGFVQDLGNNVATPYTLFIQKKIEINPLIFTFDYYIFSSNCQLDKKVYTQACLLRFVETIREFVKNYGFSKYKKFIDDLSDNNILSSNRNLFYQLGELSKYSIHLHQETWISEYLDSCAEKYVLQYKENNYLFDIWKFNSEARPWIEKVIVNENEQLDELEKYALSGFCQRNRPLLCLLMGKIYRIDFKHLTGLVRAIEYFHSASLILDDLPTQDNASFRRGKLAFHKKYSPAEAQITAVSLISKGYNELGNILTDDSSKIKIIQYASNICSNNGLCLGQIKDLKCRENQEVSLDNLKEIAYLKTGLAIEFCLVSVSILAKDSAENIEKLKLFSKYVGIAYQIKDDLKDSLSLLDTGKDKFLDKTNKTNSSFLYLLESVEAKKLLEHYKSLAIDTLLKIDLDLRPLEEFIELCFAFIDL